MQKILCLLDELDDPGAKGVMIHLPDSDKHIEILLVRKAGEIHAYHNRCPHTGVQLEWVPDQFLDLDRHYIQCAAHGALFRMQDGYSHGALFRMQDGYCVRGPCAGDFLVQVDVQLMDGAVVMADWDQLAQLQT